MPIVVSDKIVFKDFKDCVAKNQDKKSPEGFCAVLIRKIESRKPNKAKRTSHE